MNYRAHIFWLSDQLRGTGIHRTLRELELVNGAPISAPALAKRGEALRAILSHAVRTVPFYKAIASFDLPSFPVVNKSIIRSQSQAFVSSSFTTDKLMPVVTSGSTGTPFKTLRNIGKISRNAADTLYFASLAGFRVGEPLYYLKIWSDYNRKSRFTEFMQNIIPVDVIKLDAPALGSLVGMLMSDKRRKHLLGYSSALEQLCLYLNANDIAVDSCRVASIIAMSEALNDYTRATLRHKFGVEPFSRYSNIENGVLAQQTPLSDGRFLINVATYFVEILDMNDDVPTQVGQMGRIVVTDLYNYGMPLIRYDTGDIGSFAVDSEAKVCGHYLSCVEGRKLDQLFNTTGELVSSYIVYKNMWQYTEIKQYQLIQVSKRGYVFKVNADQGFTREQQLKAEFREHLGTDADFVVQYVDEIPLLASGKRKKIVNKYLEQRNILGAKSTQRFV
jgi:phenylacetate-CoA ligase